MTLAISAGRVLPALPFGPFFLLSSTSYSIFNTNLYPFVLS